MKSKTKLISVLSLLACALFAGCASTGGTNPVADWQKSRIFEDKIESAQAKAVPLTLDDVTYTSSLKNPVLAAPVNTFALIPAALYLQVVKGVDGLAATQDGRQIYIGVQNDVAAGAKIEALFAKMTPEQKKCYDAYCNYVKATDQESVIRDVIAPLIARLANEAVKVQALVEQLQGSPEFKALAGLEAMRAARDIASDASALSTQFSDATSGANLWLELLKKDAEAKKYMQDYSAE